MQGLNTKALTLELVRAIIIAAVLTLLSALAAGMAHKVFWHAWRWVWEFDAGRVVSALCFAIFFIALLRPDQWLPADSNDA